MEQLEQEDKCVKSKGVEITHRLGVGDKVWMLNPNKSKLQPEKTGPGIITAVLPNNTYRVQGLGKRRSDCVLHHNVLRLCKA